MALAAIGILILNDQILKAAFPGWWSGKLSDFVGLVFAPLMLQAAWEVVTARGRSWTPSHVSLVAAAVATGIAFIVIKTTPAGAELYGLALGALQWPVHAVGALAGGRSLPPVVPAPVAQDATDLIALGSLGVAYFIGRSRVRRAQAPG